MKISTWRHVTTGMREATHSSYMRKTSEARSRPEVRKAWENFEEFCSGAEESLKNGTYHVGKYRHFMLQDKKKARSISVLWFRDRCVQNDLKEAFQPLILRFMTSDMMGGLPGRGVLAGGTGRKRRLAARRRYAVVEQVRRLMNNERIKYLLQGDISKFYDNVDKVVSIRMIEKKVKDPRTLALTRQHLFNQKKLAIGDPFSHLIANMNMSIIIRKAKEKYGRKVVIINFADDILAGSEEKEVLVNLRRDLARWAKEIRLKYKPMYIREKAKEKEITFCGYRFGIGYVKLTQRTKKKYVKARHKKRSMGSYQGILEVADTKHLRQLIETNDNRHMKEKIRRPFAGRPMKIETMEGIKHTIVDFQEKVSKQKDCEKYYHIQAIADGIGLIVYSTGSKKITEFLANKSKTDIPIRDMVIVHDWSGFYYDGTVYTDAEEEEMIRKKYDI